MRTPFVNHDNPEVSHGPSAMKPATTVACANDAEVLDGLLRALGEFVFGLSMRFLWMYVIPLLPVPIPSMVDIAHHRDLSITPESETKTKKLRGPAR